MIVSEASTQVPSGAPLSASRPEGDPLRRCPVDALDDVREIAGDGTVQAGPEHCIHDHVRVGEPLLEDAEIAAGRKLRIGPSNIDVGVVIDASFAGYLLALRDEEDVDPRSAREEVSRDHEAVAAIVAGAADHHEARGVEGSDAGYRVGCTAPGVFHQDDTGHMAGLDGEAIVGAHLRSREDGNHGCPSKTTTAAATPASCVMETCARTTPSSAAISAARPRNSIRGASPLARRISKTWYL